MLVLVFANQKSEEDFLAFAESENSGQRLSWSGVLEGEPTRNSGSGPAKLPPLNHAQHLRHQAVRALNRVCEHLCFYLDLFC